MKTYVKCTGILNTKFLTLNKVYERLRWGAGKVMVCNDAGNHVDYVHILFGTPFTDVKDTPVKFAYTIDLLKDQIAIVSRDITATRNRMSADTRALHASILTLDKLNDELSKLLEINNE